ncbi:ABC transporter ATP-binding protein/permease [Falcatimonas sp. MSJ-15]|uniref:ABC transporter ATP-binding protein n=1 Tax=Falcatimonas sp. MSJ-15 TaxID=2841515 RepID=UPI001C116827|nr:ABC transporter ATP-binding protein [Falcatimonas sp. MSJ-15]MBU5469715.1 ABC transporter ATP-binding protein/permease [Falcatimonas sp. MSJ-15]
MKKYLYSNKKEFIMYLLTVPIMAIMSILFCKALQPVLDIVLTGKQKDFAKYSILAICFAILDMTATALCKRSKEKYRAAFLKDVKKDIFAGIFKKDIVTFSSKGSSYYMNILNRDVYQMCESYFDALCGIYRVAVCFAVTFVTLVFISPYIALLNIAVGLLSVIIPGRFERKLNDAQNNASNNAENYIRDIKDSFGGFSTIKLFNIQNKIMDKVNVANVAQEDSTYKSNMLNYYVGWISMLCTSLSYVLTIVVGTWLVLRGSMTAGMVLMISQLIGGILSPFEELPMYVAEYKSVGDLKEKINSMLDVSEERETDKADIMGDNTGLSLSNVSFSYDGEVNQIEDISVQFEPGKKYVIVGESGSGKSTLAKLIMGFYDNFGEIKLDGVELADYKREQLYGSLNYMQQDVFLFADSLYNNITLYKKYDSECVEDVIDRAGLRELVDSLPDGLLTLVSENGSNLSGGEKQRIGIARALLSGAKYLVLDEVTASLDAIMENQIENTILDISSVGSIIITHRLNPNLLNRCDEIIVLRDGRIAEKGSFNELMQQKGYFYGFYIVNHE